MADATINLNRLRIAQRNTELTSPDGTLPPDAPDWIWEVDNPYLHGPYAPIKTEMTVDELEVIGDLPADLCGAYIRNSPVPVHKPVNRYHAYDGDGMLQGVYFRDGKASYANKWIRTKALLKEQEAGASIWPGIMGPFDFSLPYFPIKDSSNTDIIYYNGKLLSLWYNAGEPYHIDPLTLDTYGPETFDGHLKHTLSAHSKVDLNTGELLFFTYGNKAPYMTYGVASPLGELVHEVPIDLPGPRLPHDLGFTPNYTILHDFPVFQDEAVFKQAGKRIVRFHPDVPTRYGIIPRFGDSDAVTWFECDPCYLLHVINCWEEGDWIVMDGCRQPDPVNKPDAADGDLASMLAQRRRVFQLYRWQFNLKTGEVREHLVDDLNTEFPMINPLYGGRRSQFTYNQYIPLLEDGGRTLKFEALVKYHTDTGTYERWDYGPGIYGSEAPFAPRLGAAAADAEDDGYVLTMTTDVSTWRSECLIFDAGALSQGPIARVKLPQRLPTGFHTRWVRGEDIYQACQGC